MTTNGHMLSILMNKKLFLIPLLFLLTCCNESSLIKEGKYLFKSLHLGKNNVVGCISCHTTKSEVVTVGPSLSGLALRADKIVKNMSAKEYIRQSIVNPDAYVVSGYSPAVMFSHYQEELSEAEIDALVVYLLQLN